FELGGHSLLATRVIARIRQVLEVDLPLRAFFEHPTLVGLARAVERERSAASGLSIPPLARRQDAGPAPLSYAQQRLWVMDRLVPGSPFYNLTTAVRLSGDLDITVFRRTVNEIVRRHEVLRTAFLESDQGPRQLVLPAAPLGIPLVDLQALGEEERRLEARRLGSEEALAAFDLTAGWLIRCRLLRLRDRDHVILCTMHHIVSDYLSLGVFVEEVGILYAAFFRGEASPLPEPPVQYADFAAWQRQWLIGEVLDSEIAYWTRQLAGAPTRIALRADRSASMEPDFRGATRTFELPAPLVADLRRVSRAEGGTLFMTLLAAYGILLSHLSGQDDLVVGTPIGYRNWPEIESSIGLFANTLALRCGLGGNPTFGELLARVRQTVLGAFAHQHVPFERLVEELRLERSLSDNPLFQVTFNLVETAAAPPPAEAGSRGEASGVALRPFEIDRETAQFDLALVLTGGGGDFTGSLQYKTALFDASTMGWLLEQFRRLLERVAVDPAVNLYELRQMLVQADEERRAATDQALEEASFRKFKERRRRTVPSTLGTSGEV
ncbi:MAG TPA: condensation domain-containing protein, partial [Thermoanaerobaculia bacterium]|nr:condensation domain-containing protein [Thermoanaerobaculia bacterium]